MIEHLWHCAVLFAFDPAKALIAAVSVTGAAAMLLFLRGNIPIKWKALAIYAHLSLVIFPIIFFALTMHCGPACNTPLANIILYSLPLSIGIASFAGFVAIPMFFMHTGHEIKNGHISGFMKSQSKRMGINVPKVYLARTGKAVAFSFKSVFSAVFVSKKLVSMLNRKELEAVLLHEMAHISSKSSILKLSAFLMKFSPLSVFSQFGSDLSLEEKKADEFVVKTQKTKKHLLSAKRKMEELQ